MTPKLVLPENISNALLGFASPPIEVEKGCFLVGVVENKDVRVDYLANKRAGSASHVDIGDAAEVTVLLEDAGLFCIKYIVGWAHTHPWTDGHLFISGTDVNAQRELQKSQPCAVALVVSSDGMNAYKTVDKRGTNKYYEIDCLKAPNTGHEVYLEDLL